MTGKPKVTYIGMSQGSAQGLYALTKDQDYYADRINRLIMVAPCMAAFTKLTPDQLAAEYTSYYVEEKLVQNDLWGPKKPYDCY